MPKTHGDQVYSQAHYKMNNHVIMGNLNTKLIELIFIFYFTDLVLKSYRFLVSSIQKEYTQ